MLPAYASMLAEEERAIQVGRLAAFDLMLKDE